MDRELIENYLRRSEMTPVQSEALSNVFVELDQSADRRFAAFELRMDDRFAAFEQRMDDRFAAFEQRMDDRFAAFEKRMDDRLASFEQRMIDRFDVERQKTTAEIANLKADLTWRMIAFIVLLGAAMSIFEGFVG